MSLPLTQIPEQGFTGFANAPVEPDPTNLDADIAVLGIPHGTPYGMAAAASPCASAPAAIRAGSARTGRFIEHYDYDLDGTLLDGKPIRLADCGDVPAEPLDISGNVARARDAVRAVLDRGAVPIVLGGDDSIPIPVLRAYEGRGPLTIIQIDAHIDWRHEIDGVTEGLSSPMRRASEMSWVSEMVQIGMRGVGSARPSDAQDALDAGVTIIKAREVHEHGAGAILDHIPAGHDYFITVDCDGLDPSIMPAVGAPTPGGLTYFQTIDILQGIAAKGRIAGMDLVELAPSRDVNGITALTGSRLIFNLIGAMARSGQLASR